MALKTSEATFYDTPAEIRNPQLGVSCAVLLVLLSVVLARAAWQGIPRAAGADPLPPAVCTVDPNVAPWWELTILPRIGETSALAIVQYRESAAMSSPEAERSPAFVLPNDLQAVHGIGPKTVQRITPYLRLRIGD